MAALLGPPELHNIATPPQPQRQPVDPSPQYPLMENGSRTNHILSSGNPCLDFFFHVVPETGSRFFVTPPLPLTDRLHAAWAHDPLTTLKLVCNLRGVRGTGKGDREGFYTAALSLYPLHPKTLACNVASFASFGYFKDLLELIYRILEGPDVRKKQKATLGRKRTGGILFRDVLTGQGSSGKCCSDSDDKGRYSRRRMVPREIRIKNAIERNKIEKEKARKLRKENQLATAKKVVERYYQDPDFRFLYDSVSDHFAECLKNDMKFYEAGEFRKVSLAAKWCPSLYSSFDRTTLICESIARKVFPRESYPEYGDVEEAHYAYRVRDRLRKQVLVPLRKVLELPERYISAKRLDLIPFNRVPSVARKIYKMKYFYKRDKARFFNYLKEVRYPRNQHIAKVISREEARIAAVTLLPHEIMSSELQWNRMVNDLLKKGKLTNSMAVLDTSESMYRNSLVASALSVLVSELSEEPWKGKMVTFSTSPELQNISFEGDLKSKIFHLDDKLQSRIYIDFQKVFDLILQVAVNGKLKPEQLVKRLFVFTDMDFDEASMNPWETEYETIRRKYTEKGYGAVVPDIVFWNMRNTKAPDLAIAHKGVYYSIFHRRNDPIAPPVAGGQKGVIFLRGFSRELLSLFFDNGGSFDPELVMKAAISGEEYQKLVVVD